MRPRTLTALAAVGLAVAAPVALAQATPRGEFNSGGILQLGTGSTTSGAKPGGQCVAIKAPHADLHGMKLRGANFDRADLRNADFSYADLRGARFRGAKLRRADFSGANLKGANFGPPRRSGKRANQAQPAPPCSPSCSGANLAAANSGFAYL